MTRPSMTTAVAALSAVVWLALPAMVSSQEAGETEARGLTSPDVQESLSVNPTEQGNLPPDPLSENDGPRLYDLLADVRRAPPTLDASGSMHRPNALASEPAKEMAPEQAEEMSLFPEGYVE